MPSKIFKPFTRGSLVKAKFGHPGRTFNNIGPVAKLWAGKSKKLVVTFCFYLFLCVNFPPLTGLFQFTGDM